MSLYCIYLNTHVKNLVYLLIQYSFLCVVAIAIKIKSIKMLLLLPNKIWFVNTPAGMLVHKVVCV